MPENTENKQWSLVFSTSDEFRIGVCKLMLEEEGITAVVMNKHDSRYHFGDYELYVDRDDAVKALHLLRNCESNE